MTTLQLSAEIADLRRALREIASLDYRGYPHECAQIAQRALDANLERMTA